MMWFTDQDWSLYSSRNPIVELKFWIFLINKMDSVNFGFKCLDWHTGSLVDMRRWSVVLVLVF